MRWQLKLIGDNFSDILHFETRQEMRNAAQFYRTLCDPPLNQVIQIEKGF